MQSERGRHHRPAAGAGIALVAVLVLVACAKPQADIPLAMTPIASPSIASPSIGDGGIELAAQAASTYGENHRDTFAGLYVDASQAHVVIRFTSDVARHQAALDALAGRQGMYIVRSATWTEDALLHILQALSDAQLELQKRGISLIEIGPNPYTSEDRIEGVRARAEKRAPVWKGR